MLSAWETSGLSMAAFSRRHGLTDLGDHPKPATSGEVITDPRRPGPTTATEVITDLAALVVVATGGCCEPYREPVLRALADGRATMSIWQELG